MSNAAPGGLLGLNRKAMEEERLRRRKRTADEAQVTVDERPQKLARYESISLPGPVNVQAKSTPSETIITKKPMSPVHNEGNASSTKQKLEYPLGALKRTWAFGYNRKNDIKIEELLQRDTLHTAIISSWQWDFDWLISKIHLRHTKWIFVMEAKTPAEKERMHGEFVGLEKHVRLCFPPMSNNLFARMHSKLMLLFHPDYLRVVIPSANPVMHDWGETGKMENMVFVIDLPRLGTETANNDMTPFQSELVHFLEAMELPEDARKGLLNFDFSRTADLAFVHSIPGSYEAETAKQSGLAGLSQMVKSLNLETPADKNFEVDLAAASVGSLDDAQVTQFCASLRGLNPYESFKASRSDGEGQQHNDTFRLVFPSEQTVKQSKGGPGAGGTIFLNSSAFEKPTFPRRLLHEYTSTRKGLLSHNKLVLVRTSQHAYIYNGSANFSQSAWGRFTLPKKSQQPKLTITNWECGVLIPVARAMNATADGIMPYDVFGKHLDIPFACPPRSYGEGMKPWVTKMHGS